MSNLTQDQLNERLLSVIISDIDTDAIGKAIVEGADVKKIDGWGFLPIHYAAANGKTEACRILIEAGSPVNVADNKYGNLPIHDAAENDYAEICRLLVEAGSPVNVVSNDGWSPIDAAAVNGHTETAALLKQHGGVE